MFVWVTGSRYPWSSGEPPPGRHTTGCCRRVRPLSQTTAPALLPPRDGAELAGGLQRQLDLEWCEVATVPVKATWDEREEADKKKRREKKFGGEECELSWYAPASSCKWIKRTTKVSTTGPYTAALGGVK
ncbi:hypothetical protein JZ751_011327 [Albula glossodonta]|uniref:Uncharacterized protein n=1 Tax=Albula glossodonta TaxID=121402 RepID=A0A8T2MMG2_9TELE|nr:hypothetical protein JZ751_011327 [Albula glossodonta]